jgi:hypothetical protein
MVGLRSVSESMAVTPDIASELRPAASKVTASEAQPEILLEVAAEALSQIYCSSAISLYAL